MKKKLTIWAAFVLFVFFILCATGLFTSLIFRLAIYFKLFENYGYLIINPISVVLMISVILGTLLSATVSRKFMKSIYELRDATQKVASGDFSVQIEEKNPIFEIQTLNEDFNKMVKELASIETLKDDFITSVSHEIKTPIAAIEGCMELLKDQQLTEEEKNEYMKLMELSVKRLSVLTSNILRLSKLDNQQIMPDQTEFSLDEQIRRAILLLERKWSVKKLNLNIELNPVRVFANKELLMQVWVNLIDNAVKFSKDGSDINIDLYQADDKAHVKIKDYGIGMNEETTARIFQKFYQGNKSRSNQGNGLGLALVKRILELSGGRVSVESEVGKGSTFMVTMPYR